MRIVVVAAIAVISTATPSGARTQINPTNVQHDIVRGGAHHTVATMVANGHWNQALARIDAGDRRWIALAPRLAPGTDAATSEALTIALATALPKAPLAVLDAVEPSGTLSLRRVCSAPFIEPKAGFVAQYAATSLRALAAVHTRASRQCSAMLESTR